MKTIEVITYQNNNEIFRQTYPNCVDGLEAFCRNSSILVKKFGELPYGYYCINEVAEKDNK